MEKTIDKDIPENEIPMDYLKSSPDFVVTPDKKYNGEKVYDITFGGTPIEVDACTMVMASDRVKRYLNILLEESQSQTGSNRCFWADIIMLNVLTTKIINKASPYKVERMLNPVKYHTKSAAAKYYRQEQENIEKARRAETENKEEE